MMKGIKLFILLVGLAFAGWGCSDQGSTSASNEPGEQLSASAQKGKTVSPEADLFTIVDNQQAAAEGNKYIQAIKDRPTTAGVQIARLKDNPAGLLTKGSTIGLSVSADQQFVATGARVTKRAADGISWSGPLQNHHGHATLVLTGHGITGTLWADSTLYKFEPIGDGLQAIVKINRSKLPPEHPSKYSSGALVDTAKVWGGDSTRRNKKDSLSINKTKKLSILTNGPNSGPDIDVLVVYTPSVASHTNDINGLIQTAITETNDSYANSNVYANVHLAHTLEVSYNESGRSFQDHIDAMHDLNDGIMDNINPTRNEYLADVVVLLVNDQQACGLADEISAQMTSAFAAVHYTCATGNYSFGHEIGHLFGARHNMEQDDHENPFKYGHGYISPNNNWRTIMAYPYSCNFCQRVQYWSNPNVNYSDGLAMGTSTYEDNARALNRAKYTLRDFRTLLHPTNFTLTNRYSYGDHPHFTWTSNSEATSSTLYRCTTTGSYSPWCFQGVGGGSGGGAQEFTDYGVTIHNPNEYPYDCPKTAIYHVTNRNRTGESSWLTQISMCVDSNY